MSNWLEIENKVIIVTGGSSGIGNVIVKELLDNGAVVYNADIKGNDLSHKNYHFIQTDVTNKENVSETVKDVIQNEKKIDILVNNAGINLPRLQ